MKTKLQEIETKINKEGFSTSDFYEMYENKEFELERFSKKLPPQDKVWDEDESVKWNREKTARETERILKEEKEHSENQGKLNQLERKAIITSFSNEYNLSQRKVEIAYGYAYSEGHSGGMQEVMNILYDVIGLYIDMEIA